MSIKTRSANNAFAPSGGREISYFVAFKGHTSVLMTFRTHNCWFNVSVPRDVQRAIPLLKFCGFWLPFFSPLPTLTVSGVYRCPQQLYHTGDAPARGTPGAPELFAFTEQVHCQFEFELCSPSCRCSRAWYGCYRLQDIIRIKVFLLNISVLFLCAKLPQEEKGL